MPKGDVKLAGVFAKTLKAKLSEKSVMSIFCMNPFIEFFGQETLGLVLVFLISIKSPDAIIDE